MDVFKVRDSKIYVSKIVRDSNNLIIEKNKDRTFLEKELKNLEENPERTDKPVLSLL